MLALLAMLVSLSACEPAIPDGVIKVKNDSQDKHFNVVQVSAGGKTYSLKPGDFILLSKGTASINFSRRYKDFVRRYSVQCPSKLDKGILIKLIDVHLDRLPGGCRTVGASR